MTTTDSGAFPPPPPAAPGSTSRLLRRSRDGRIGAGVAAGLGDYFGFDPVLFRVLFATAAFFGGAGVIAYLIAWIAIPEEGTERAPIDGWISALRRHHVPLWVVVVGAGLLLWGAAFSWWAPGPFLPVLAIVVILVVVFGRRGGRWGSGPTAQAPGATRPGGPVDLTKPSGAAASATTAQYGPGGGAYGTPAGPSWVSDARAWIDESRSAARERRRRALPVRLTAVISLVATLVVLGIVDAVSGIPLPVYFWVTGGIVLLALLTGLALRRTPWSLTVLLIPSLAGLIAFGATDASLHDGIGSHEWRPTSSLATQYRLGLGQGVLDLRSLTASASPRTVDVTLAAGQIKIIAPRTLNLTVQAHLRIGELSVDGQTFGSGHGHGGGFDYSRTVEPLPGATGAPVTVDVHLADGQIAVERR